MRKVKGSALSAPAGHDSPLVAIIDSQSWVSAMVSLKLSPRERQILESLIGGADGESLIAERLGMSPRTVHTHVERLYRKLHVTSRSQLLVSLFVEYAAQVKAGQADKKQR